MILHLPEVSFEFETEPATGCKLDLETVERRKERLVEAVDERLRPDQVRERPREVTVRCSSGETRPCGLAPRMVDADSDPAIAARFLRVAIEDVLDTTGALARDRAQPGEIDVTADVSSGELDAEGPGALVHLEP